MPLRTQAEISAAFESIKRVAVTAANSSEIPPTLLSEAALNALQIVETVVCDLHRIADAVNK